MPIYDYACKKCGKKFAVTMPITEHGKKKVQCPKCSSKQVSRLIQAVFATTSKKS